MTTKQCPRCSKDVQIIDGRWAQHSRGDQEYATWCAQGGFEVHSLEGFLVFVGRVGYPLPIEAIDEDFEGPMAIAHFATRELAQKWIDEHPKAKSPMIYELRSSE